MIHWPTSVKVVYRPCRKCLCLYLFVVGGEKENFFHRVVEHKDIKKVVVLLKTSVSCQKNQVTEVLKQFSPLRVIWDEDKNLKVKVCLPANITCSCFDFYTNPFSYTIMIILNSKRNSWRANHLWSRSNLNSSTTIQFNRKLMISIPLLFLGLLSCQQVR